MPVARVNLSAMAWHSTLLEFIVRQTLARPSLPYIAAPHATYLHLACAHGAAADLAGDTALWLRLSAQLSQLREPQLLALFSAVRRSIATHVAPDRVRLVHAPLQAHRRRRRDL